MKEKGKRIIVTSALPYANGDIHIGHLVEYLQTDFWVRFQKMLGRECYYFCADDTHGTPIMLSAQKQGIKPEELIAKSKENHLKDFLDFGIYFDNYSSTNNETNKEIVREVYEKIKSGGHIENKVIKQFYCEHDKMFLPDRFVKGVCPKCSAEEQYGDSCDKCGSTYRSNELKNAKCSLCDNSPVERESEHLFFKLRDFQEFLIDWVKDHTPKEVNKKLKEWLDNELLSWDISRDFPYFGFKIPGYEDKYFYVWLDAPVGYLSSAKEWCVANGKDFNDFWHGEESEIYHFIGKDIVYFHTLFWPAMLKAAEFKLPKDIFVHGFLTLNGEKMSKSKGTLIKARSYLNHLDYQYLRYYYASKLNSSLGDIDLSVDDFVNKVNSELVGKISNLASRSMQMLKKNFSSQLSVLSNEGKELLSKALESSEKIKKSYEDRDYSRVIIIIRDLADDANRYFDKNKPWEAVKKDPQKAQQILSDVINYFRVLAIYLKPILPTYADNVASFFNEEVYLWDDLEKILENQEIKEYKHLAGRVELKKWEKIMEESLKSSEEKDCPKDNYQALEKEISIEDFIKVDIRVAKIIKAEEIPEAKKLLKIQLDLGFEQRQVFAGIKSAYKAEDLIGRLVACVVNLKPRKMKFGVSQGMIMAAGPGKGEIFILSPDSGAKPGMRIT